MALLAIWACAASAASLMRCSLSLNEQPSSFGEPIWTSWRQVLQTQVKLPWAGQVLTGQLWAVEPGISRSMDPGIRPGLSCTKYGSQWYSFWSAGREVISLWPKSAPKWDQFWAKNRKIAIFVKFIRGGSALSGKNLLFLPGSWAVVDLAKNR